LIYRIGLGLWDANKRKHMEANGNTKHGRIFQSSSYQSAVEQIVAQLQFDLFQMTGHGRARSAPVLINVDNCPN